MAQRPNIPSCSRVLSEFVNNSSSIQTPSLSNYMQQTSFPSANMMAIQPVRQSQQFPQGLVSVPLYPQWNNSLPGYNFNQLANGSVIQNGRSLNYTGYAPVDYSPSVNRLSNPSVALPKQYNIPNLMQTVPDLSMRIEDRIEHKHSICQWIDQGETEPCLKEFQTIQDIVDHLRDWHAKNNERHVCLWKDCERSNKPFRARYKLSEHLRVHTGEKPFVCSRCEKKFARKENMKIHFRIHTEEKPFACRIEGCEKRFSNSSDRKKHEQVHKAGRPYACPEVGCDRAYSHASSLRKHMRTHGHKKKARSSLGSDGASASESPESHVPARKIQTQRLVPTLNPSVNPGQSSVNISPPQNYWVSQLGFSPDYNNNLSKPMIKLDPESPQGFQAFTGPQVITFSDESNSPTAACVPSPNSSDGQPAFMYSNDLKTQTD